MPWVSVSDLVALAVATAILDREVQVTADSFMIE
jgi:hypothetical protein